MLARGALRDALGAAMARVPGWLRFGPLPRVADVAHYCFAFMYGVFLGIVWEFASLGVLLLASAIEYVTSTLFMGAIFLALCGYLYSVASKADLARPLVSILLFRITAQVAMTLGTGSLLLTTMLHDTPACTSGRLRNGGWRRPLAPLLRRLPMPRRWLRRVLGVKPPHGPPFLRVLAAIASRDWLWWVPSWATLGMPSILELPGTITFKAQASLEAAPAAEVTTWRHPPHGRVSPALQALLPGSAGQELAGVYTYACRDQLHGDFYYIFQYQTYWIKPASGALLHSVVSLVIKMLLMHAFASLFMLLSQGNCREAYLAELRRRLDRVYRWFRPRPPVRLIPIEPDDLCAFCHEELMKPPPGEADEAPNGEPVGGGGAASRWLGGLGLQGGQGWLGWLRVLGGRGQPLAQATATPAAPQTQGAAPVAQAAAEMAARTELCEEDATSEAQASGGDVPSATNAPAPEGLAADVAPADGAMDGADGRYVVYCRWGCGKAVHRACFEAWGRNKCVYCPMPMN